MSVVLNMFNGPVPYRVWISVDDEWVSYFAVGTDAESAMVNFLENYQLAHPEIDRDPCIVAVAPVFNGNNEKLVIG